MGKIKKMLIELENLKEGCRSFLHWINVNRDLLQKDDFQFTRSRLWFESATILNLKSNIHLYLQYRDAFFQLEDKLFREEIL